MKDLTNVPTMANPNATGPLRPGVWPGGEPESVRAAYDRILTEQGLTHEPDLDDEEAAQ